MTKKFFSFVAGISFFFGCADIPDELRDQADGKCGGSKYTEYQFCANGRIYDLCNGVQYNPSVVGCCNSRQQYTLATEFCYSGLYVYPKCGGNTYNLETQFCSGSKVFSKCGGSSYDPDRYFCYDNNSYSLCGGKEYNPSTQACKSGIVEGKCGSSSYNVSTEFCLNSKVYSLCGGKTYDPSNQKCESSVVKTKCDTGSNYYNPSTEFCSGSSVYSLCSGKTYDPSNHRCGWSDSIYSSTNWGYYEDGYIDEYEVVETKCGTNDWYDTENTNLRCELNVVEIKCGSKWYAIPIAPPSTRCLNNVLEASCGSGWYNVPNTNNLRCGYYGEVEVEAKCGFKWYNASNTNLRCQNDVLETKCGSGWYAPLAPVATYTQYCKGGSTLTQYGSITYYGQTYKTVEIGTQTWMAENLNYNASGSVCYDNIADNCTKYGRLYNWATAIVACPEGWHLPSKEEWETLIITVGGSSTAGKMLQRVNPYNDYYDEWWYNRQDIMPWEYYTNEYGFSALPGGNGYPNGYFSGVGVGDYGYYWSASEVGSRDEAYSRYMDSQQNVDYRNPKGYLFSVRCLKD